jgi:hypothetical protein
MEFDKFVIDNLGFDKFEFDKIGLQAKLVLIKTKAYPDLTFPITTLSFDDEM